MFFGREILESCPVAVTLIFLYLRVKNRINGFYKRQIDGSISDAAIL